MSKHLTGIHQQKGGDTTGNFAAITSEVLAESFSLQGFCAYTTASGDADRWLICPF